MKLLNYDHQTQEFITKTSASIDVRLSPHQICPIYCDKKPYIWSGYDKGRRYAFKLPCSHGKCYSVQIKTARSSYTFNFWSSLKDAYEASIKRALIWDMQPDLGRGSVSPRPYDILACLSGSIDAQNETFKGFCDNFGYSEDSIKAKTTYDAVCDEGRALSSLFSREELDLLREIN